MTKKTKLELTWPGKEERPKLEPRILIEDPDKSYRAEGPGGVQGPGSFDNILIKGDNLLALKALEAEYAGKVKCVFIDPPYNTGSAFAEYEDGVEHSLWLSLIRDRIQHLYRLLSDDGSLWITIDDNEAHYLKVVCDEIFGRKNFLANAVWQKAYGPRSNAHLMSSSHDHVLIYVKDIDLAEFNLLPRSKEQEAKYKNPDDDPRGPWKGENSSISLLSGARGRQYAKTGHSPNLFEITAPNGQKHWPPKNRCWAFSPEKYEILLADNRIWFGPKGDGRPSVKRFLNEISQGTLPQTVWQYDEVGHNQEASREIKELFPDKPFPTPKPERLLERVLTISTSPGDLVLDSFAGSGTTGAVAQKMGRRWIMVEIGDHADTHIVPRLKKVIDGEDQGGISKSVEWRGGGGFRYYTLAPSLLEKDKWGNWVVAKEYDPNMLAAAMCKHLGFTYAPSEDEGEWWRHGQSSETDFLYVTTQSLTRDALKLLSDEVGEGRSLMICAPAFSGSFDDFENLSCTKIPSAILSRCEWGRDDYSLDVSDPVPDDDEVDSGHDAGADKSETVSN